MAADAIPLAGTDLDDKDKRAWLRLLRSQNVGPGTFFRLLRRFGGAQAAIQALPDLAARGGAARPPAVPSPDEIDEELRAGHDLGAVLIAKGCPGYPPLLAHIHSAPPLLWARGDPDVLSRPAIAIVGSRNASAAGRATARKFAAELGAAGFAIVSGFARGIDTAAHEASLDTGTIAVFAGGIGVVYPPENGDLAERVAAAGAIIAERAPFAQPRGRDFPARNRIISGLSYGVFVVEAAHRSGTLITARFALEQGRDVFAAPGHIGDPRAAGTNGLIKTGAQLVTEPDDIVAAVAPSLQEQAPAAPLHEPPASYDDDAGDGVDRATDCSPKGLVERIHQLLNLSGTPVDTLIREAGAPAAQVQAALMELEIAGRVQAMDGQRVRATVPTDD